MHSTLVRVQSVFGFFTSAAFAVAAAIAFSVLLIPQAPSASLELKNVQVVKGRPHYYSTKREEYAHVKFDLDAGTYRDITQANAINKLTQAHRLDLPLQLEHQTSLRLHHSLLPFLITLYNPGLRARNLGRYHPRRRRAHTPEHLHPPDPQIRQSKGQESQESCRQAIPRRWQPRHHQA
jgi:hypothetical protein